MCVERERGGGGGEERIHTIITYILIILYSFISKDPNLIYCSVNIAPNSMKANSLFIASYVYLKLIFTQFLRMTPTENWH